jgi:hypothetical protein
MRERLSRPVPTDVRRRDSALPVSEPGEPRTATPTIRLAGGGHGPSIVVAVVAVFLAIAWIKPWPSAAPRAAVVPAGPTRPPPEPTTDPLSDLKYHCQEPPGWRVYARERWAGRALRSWRTMEPARAATGPLDPGIPVIPLGATIVNLGFCSPWNTAERPPAGATVAAWRLTARTDPRSGWDATPIELRATAPTPATEVAGLFAPPARGFDPGSSSVDGIWAAGRWVFTVREADYERWWAIDVQLPGPPSVPVPPGG